MGGRRALAFLSALTVAAGVFVPATAYGESDHHEREGFEKIGYFTQWGIYGRGFLPKNMVTNGQARRLTILNYAFGNVGSDGKCFEANIPGQGDAWADFQRPFSAAESVNGQADADGQALAGNFNQIRKLKKMNPGLKAQISLGGWTWSKFFSDAALTDASRRAFVSSCVDLFIKGNLPKLAGDTHGGDGAAAGVFDGIDIDWEWPGSPGNDGNVVRAVDKQNFSLMLAEFRRQLDALGRRNHRHYTLTAFLGADPKIMDAGYEVPKVFRSLDLATVQGYDMHGTWEPITNHNSALFTPAGEPQQPDFTVSRAIDALVARGAPRSKLVMGVPFYGHGWTGVPPANFGLFQTSTGAAPGTFEAGTEDYRRLIALTGYKLYRDDKAVHAWLYNGTTFWTIDDPAIVSQKMRYIRCSGLGGAMVWSLDGDDDNGTLFRTIDRGLRDD